MRISAVMVGWIVVLCFPSFVGAEAVQLELVMPGTVFGPGSICFLDAELVNTGSALNEAQFFVALTVGTGDYWFYPTWVHYPPDVAWENLDVAAGPNDAIRILPEFSWPVVGGEFFGAVFMAAIVYQGELASNVADYSFGWSEIPQPTHTPTGPTPTPLPYAAGDQFSTDSIVGSMRFVPAGVFTQGSISIEIEPCSSEYERPTFSHRLTRHLAVMESEVTRQMWATLLAGDSSIPADPSDTNASPTLGHPVQNSTWFEAVLFANRLSLINNRTICYYKDQYFSIPLDSTNHTTGEFYCDFNADGYRLPTEGEWEYFTRAGTTGTFSCSETAYSEATCTLCVPGTLADLENHCVYCANASGVSAVTGSKLSNPWNLKDVHGNVFEWCWDFTGYYPGGDQTDYTGPETPTFRVIRGGCWKMDSAYCRSAYRNYEHAYRRFDGLGFRLVRLVTF